MGKVVPFARKSTCEGVTSLESPGSTGLQKIVPATGTEQRAERLIGEAARLLAEAGHGADSVPWILEDCIELLRNREVGESGSVTAAPAAIDAPCVNFTGRCAQPDPRLKLNADTEVSTFIRK